ncbi:unnamed protein product [Diplocarpon coronariae]|uniref:Uncharacterized protein n=1 Tax=Diplocarpon coronariae TaxID=2795749 RepID=A0A218YZ28_9HELO|nr:protein kinase domain protein [Diplocarpon mali]OWP00266.1 hypothetical protein B2J93_3792 [Marssonina coronariae]
MHPSLDVNNRCDVTLQLLELLENNKLFTRLELGGVDTARAHVAKTRAMPGPPPQTRLDRERHGRAIPWDRTFPGPDGTWCSTAREHHGGPFFDSRDMFDDF